jgi:MFS family permease
MRNPAFRKKDSYKWWVLVTVSASSIMAALDLSILTTRLPHLASVFHTDTSVIGWLNIVYFIMTQSLMMTLSKVGGAKGRKRVFVAGLAFYTVGLLAASVSHTVGPLILARIVQGAAGATITSLGLAIAVVVFPSAQRGRALGILIGSASIGLVAGPVLGGVVLDLLGWRAIFYAGVPFLVACLVMARVIIEEQKKADGQGFTFDTAGAISLFGWLSCLLLFLSFGYKWGLTTFPSLLLATMTIFFFAGFLIAERRSAEPIAEISIFKNRLFSAGVTVVCAGLVWLIRLPVGATPFGIGTGIILVGSGVGIFHPPSNSPMVGSVPREMLGVASAIGTTARHIGSSMSLAVAGAVYGAHQSLYLPRFSHVGWAAAAARRMASVASFSDTLLAALSVACVGFMASLFRGSAGSREVSG